MRLVKQIVRSVLLGVVALICLSACSQASNNRVIIKTNEGSVHESDLYNEAKYFPTFSSTTLLQYLTFDKIFDQEFANEANAAKVQSQFTKVKRQYGSSFATLLQQQGLNVSNFKIYLKLQLLEKAAVDHEIKKTQYYPDNFKRAWENYHPPVTAFVIAEPTEKGAEALIESNAKNSIRFDVMNRESQLTFDSTSTKVPASVQKVAWKLMNGTLSNVVPLTNAVTGITSYYVVKMVKNSIKGSSMDKYRAQLEKAILLEKEQDTIYIDSVMAKELKKHQVIVLENAFSKTFSRFTSTQSSKKINF